jgi:hypothetical protein
MGPLQAIDGDVILLPPFVYGSRFRVQGSRFKVQGSRVLVFDLTLFYFVFTSALLLRLFNL